MDPCSCCHKTTQIYESTCFCETRFSVLPLFQEVEREISFRTECGLYYSYYKQMLQAPSIQEGMYCQREDVFAPFGAFIKSSPLKTFSFAQ